MAAAGGQAAVIMKRAAISDELQAAGLHRTTDNNTAATTGRSGTISLRWGCCRQFAVG